MEKAGIAAATSALACGAVSLYLTSSTLPEHLEEEILGLNPGAVGMWLVTLYRLCCAPQGSVGAENVSLACVGVAYLL